MKLVTWNVNGIKACIKNEGFETLLKSIKADIYCFQEVKAKTVLDVGNYYQYWNLCQSRKGYSGTLVLTKKEPLSIKLGMGIEQLEQEGRCITLEFEDFVLINVYLHN